ncbi:MAG: S-layer homology domain-containing protein [Clostridia bacterium]|jgi:hypothetical protein|nr:S-layer homology domain-containing protein [Clostridia bacterium]
MKKKIVMIIIFIIAFSKGNALEIKDVLPKVKDNYVIGSNFEESFKKIIKLKGGNYLAVGEKEYRDKEVEKLYQGYAVKLNDKFETIWSYEYGKEKIENFFDVAEEANGNYIMVGKTNDYNEGSAMTINENGYMVSVNKDGEKNWEKIYGDRSSEVFYGIEPIANNKFFVYGQKTSATGDVDLLVLKMNSVGTIENELVLKRPGNNYAVASSIDSKGNVWLVGSTNINPEKDYDGWIIKIDVNLNIVGGSYIGGTDIEYLNDIKILENDDFIVVGTTKSKDIKGIKNGEKEDVLVVKYDKNLNQKWIKTIGTRESDFGYFVDELNDGGYLIGAASDVIREDGKKNFDVLVSRLDISGKLIWTNFYGGTNDDIAYDVNILDNNEFLLVGETNSNNGDIKKSNGLRDTLLLKVEKEIDNIEIKIKEIKDAKAKEEALRLQKEKEKMKDKEVFADVKKDDWYFEYVMSLYAKDIIKGYPDNTFKPLNTMNVDAFIKTMVTAMGYKDIKNGEVYWAENYINKAIDLRIVNEGEFENYQRPISRYEISRIVVRALDEDFDVDVLSLQSKIIDVDENMKDIVYKIYSKGIITGYEDGTFKPLNNANRAEVSVIINRMLDKSKRK